MTPKISVPPEAESLDEFYRAYFLPLVRRVVRRHGLRPEDAGDIVQDAFVLAIGKLDLSKNPKVWLYHVVDNLAANWLRKRRRRMNLLVKFRPAGNDQSWDDELRGVSRE